MCSNGVLGLELTGLDGVLAEKGREEVQVIPSFWLVAGIIHGHMGI